MAVLQRTKAQKIALSSAIDASVAAQIKALQIEMKMVKDQNAILKSKVGKLEEPRDATNVAGAASPQALSDTLDKLKHSLPKDFITEEQVKDIFRKEFAGATQQLLDTFQKQLESSQEDLQKQLSSSKEDIQKQLSSSKTHMQNQLNVSAEDLQKQLGSSTEEIQKQLSVYKDKVHHQLNASEAKWLELLRPLKEDLQKQLLSSEKKLQDQLVSSEKKLQGQLDSSEEKIQNRLDSSERKLVKQIREVRWLLSIGTQKCIDTVLI